MAEEEFKDIEYPPLSAPSSKPFRLLNKTTSTYKFIELLDAFSDYTGKGGKLLMVKTDESGIGVTEIDVESDKTHVHVQLVASTQWTINHNLNKYPCIQIIDSSGNPAMVVIEYPSLNQVLVKASLAVAGTAYLN